MSKIKRILDFIADASYATSQLLNLFFTDYHTSYRRARGMPEYKFKSRKEWREAKMAAFKREERQRFYNLLSKLKKEGFIKKNQGGRWQITEKGKVKLTKLEEENGSDWSSTRIDYQGEKSTKFTIVVFDVPEREKQKRVWLRAVLKRLGFKMLQRSVWIAKVKLPEKFIHDLRRRRILSYVEILEITKTGSLRHIGED